MMDVATCFGFLRRELQSKRAALLWGCNKKCILLPLSEITECSVRPSLKLSQIDFIRKVKKGKKRNRISFRYIYTLTLP